MVTSSLTTLRAESSPRRAWNNHGTLAGEQRQQFLFLFLSLFTTTQLDPKFHEAEDSKSGSFSNLADILPSLPSRQTNRLKSKKGVLILQESKITCVLWPRSGERSLSELLVLSLRGLESCRSFRGVLLFCRGVCVPSTLLMVAGTVFSTPKQPQPHPTLPTCCWY